MGAHKSTPKLEEASLHDLERPIKSPAPDRQRARGQAMGAHKSTPKLEASLHDIEHPIRSPAPDRQRVRGQAMGAQGSIPAPSWSRVNLDELTNMLVDEVSSKIECWREFKTSYFFLFAHSHLKCYWMHVNVGILSLSENG